MSSLLFLGRGQGKNMGGGIFLFNFYIEIFLFANIIWSQWYPNFAEILIVK